MNNIKVDFSIKDLENLTGIKAHTIRIWEKRYNLLNPNRTDTNIRHYNIDSLKKILNISYLNKNGLKISHIALLKEEEITNKVKEIDANINTENHAVNTLKLAMINFDEALFNKTYNPFLDKLGFSKVFYTIFIPLLKDIGLLWHTNTITPAHEHFISVLIKRKILINTERIESKIKSTKTFVLFLPENEIHDIGLLFLNYELKKKNYHTVFLGESVPMENLIDLLSFYDDITFISYFTVYPEEKNILNYIYKFKNILLNKENSNFFILGIKLNNIKKDDIPEKVSIFNSIENLLEEV